MSVGLTSGNIKYVFTQAVAPSGEGEVEGSLWYDTGSNVLYTYNGSTWVLVAAGAFELVGSTILAATATSVSVTGLDLDTDKRYVIFVSIKNAYAGSNAVYVDFNADTTPTHYYFQRSTSIGGAHGDATGNSQVWVDVAGADDVTTLKLNLFLDVDGLPMFSGESVTNASGSLRLTNQAGSYTDGTNITSIQIRGYRTMGLAIGSYIKVYKVA